MHLYACASIVFFASVDLGRKIINPSGAAGRISGRCPPAESVGLSSSGPVYAGAAIKMFLVEIKGAAGEF